MPEHLLFNRFFAVNPKYFAAVTPALIDSGDVKWNGFYPHPSFVTLLEKLVIMLTGKDSRSLWLDGAYGTGKSHAALTVKSLLDAPDAEVTAYFEDYGLNMDLCQKLLTVKDSGTIITVHRTGSAAIHSDQDLITAVQGSITDALEKRGIENRGEASLKDAALKWFDEKEANRRYFNDLIHEEKYCWDFGGKSADEVAAALRESTGDAAVTMMRRILRVARDNGITAMQMDVEDTCEWIRTVIEENHLTAILFVWDEFTEYFYNNVNALTGLQTLLELSQSCPFYFLLVTHENMALIPDKDQQKKILNRFVGDASVNIKLPDNMAFRLMAQAMKVTDDPVLKPKWTDYHAALAEDLADVRNVILTDAKKNARMGQKTLLTDENLLSVIPIHPYAALLLKHMSVAFNSNARSMFDFIISGDMTDAKGFKWYIGQYGPTDKGYNLLTIDMLWDFFVGKDRNGLNDEVRQVLDAYSSLQANALTPDQERVYKTVLLLEAISQKVHDVDLLRPNSQNVDLAFSGTNWPKGKAVQIAAGLVEQGILFEHPVGNGMMEYNAVSSGGSRAVIEKLIKKVRDETTTAKLIGSGALMTAQTNPAVFLPKALAGRFILEPACSSNLQQEYRKLAALDRPNRFRAEVLFSMDDNELTGETNAVRKLTAEKPDGAVLVIQSLVPLGAAALEEYVVNTAYYLYYEKINKRQARGYSDRAEKCLAAWRGRIADGAFLLYTPEHRGGLRLANLSALQDELRTFNRKAYPCGLENYSLTDSMFTKSNLAQGAELGIRQEMKGTFSSSNEKTKISAALAGAWKTERYWEDPAKKSLPIVRIKREVDRLVQEGVARDADGVSILSVWQAMEEAPFGFMPNNISAYVMGFVLKEYVSPAYFWSNHSTSEPMSEAKMKTMIANAINQSASPNPKYREEYIRSMSPEQRAFLECTADAFRADRSLCGSVETALTRIRTGMKKLDFPIWTLKHLPEREDAAVPKKVLDQVIDGYVGAANTANSGKDSVGPIVDEIGGLVIAYPEIPQELKRLLTGEMCRKGMQAYLAGYRGGILPKLAQEVGDGGAYLTRVKERFSADAANWVWNIDTVNEKIDKVILDYRIIAESGRSPGFDRCIRIEDTVRTWNTRTNNIAVPCEALKKYTGDLSPFLEMLCSMKNSGTLPEENRQAFLDLLVSQREAFDRFYRDQLPYFRRAADLYLEDLDEEDVQAVFRKIGSGQFTKKAGDYFKYIQDLVKTCLNTQKKTRLRNLWKEHTGTKDPQEWSDRYKTPILCMFDDDHRAEAKRKFAVIRNDHAGDAEIEDAIAWLEQADFYDRLNDSGERDRCFMKRIVTEERGVLLTDADEVRRDLCKTVQDTVYNWMDNSAVQNRLNKLALKQYQLHGCEEARAVLDRMDAAQLRKYLNDLLSDNVVLGVQILKNR